MNIEHQAGEVMSLASVSVDTASGGLEQATAWRRGMETAYLVTAERCAVEQYEPPTAATLGAVLTDTIGPLGDPSAEGFSVVAEGVAERDEGPVVQRISGFGRLQSRLIEFVSTRDNAVHSSISSIRLTGSTFALRPYLARACPGLAKGEFARLLA